MRCRVGHVAVVASALVSATSIAACATSSTSSAPGGTSATSVATGRLHIVATQGPTCPVQRAGAPPCVAAYQGTIAVLTPAGTQVTEVTTSADGTADISLGAGTYTVSVPSTSSPRLPRLTQPATVTVIAGSTVTATLEFDTGIR
jgi:hypothetical protein